MSLTAAVAAIVGTTVAGLTFAFILHWPLMAYSKWWWMQVGLALGIAVFGQVLRRIFGLVLDDY